MIKHNHMQQKYFFRQLVHHLIIITLPVLILGCLLTMYYRGRLQKELSVYAERSKNYILYNVTDVLNTFAEETALFSTTPTMALSIYRLLNEQSLDYRNNVYRSLIPTIISTTSNISAYVDSVYIYYDNPYGNYFSSSKSYTSIDAPNSTDSQWLDLYLSAPSEMKQWLALRNVRNYSFEAETATVSVFRRFDYLSGVMVLNLNAGRLAHMLDSSQIYQGSCTLVADPQGNVLFGSPGWENQLEEKSVPKQLLQPAGKSESPYESASIAGIGYVYYTSEIPDYGLVMISLLPTSEVFRSVHTMVLAFTVIILFSILLSISLSWTGTLSNFRQLNNLLELFSLAEQGRELPASVHPVARNEYDLIFNNIVSTFVSNNLLKLNLAASEVRQKDAQLAALQLQLNPHFIFNTLQTLDLEILKAQPEGQNASLLVHNLSDILKYSLANTSRLVCVRDEIEICKTYSEIQKLRYKNPFILYWDYDEDVLGAPIIHLVLQPLLENSLHHGIKELPRKGLVKIKIYRRDGKIHVYVIDNGTGISADRLKVLRRDLRRQDLSDNSHIGIYNTNLRLVLTYGPEAAVRISSRKGRGTIVSFSFRTDA